VTATYTLDIPILRPPLTSNQQRGAHWTRVREARKEVGQWVRLVGGGDLPRIERCHVTVTWHAPDKRIRDAGSISAFGKAVIDELVDLGVLTKDDARYVLSETYSVRLASHPARITITLETDDEPEALEAAA